MIADPFSRHVERAEKLAPFCERLRRKEHTLLLALGDSNTCNTTFTRGGKQWPELLHSELRDHYGTQEVMLVNSGVSGNHCQDVLARLEQTALRFKPDLTVVCLGSNDRRLTPDQFSAGMNEIIDRLTAGGGLVMLRTPTPIVEVEPPPKHLWPNDVDLKERVEIIRRIARTRELAFVDTYAQWWDFEAAGWLPINAVMHDQVHTAAIGHQLVCRGILPAFGIPSVFAWEK